MGKVINARQLALIGFISVFALKLAALPSLLFSRVEADSLFVIIGIALIDLLSLFPIYFVLKRNQDISFYEFLSKHIGKVFAKFVMIVLFTFFFFKMLTLIESGYLYAQQVIFQRAPFILFLFIILAISNSLVLFKLKSYARTVEFFYPIISIMFSIFILMSLFTAELNSITPVFKAGAEIFSTAFDYSMVGGDFVFMLLFMGKIKFDKNSNKTFVGHLLLAVGLLIAFYFVNNSIFRYTGILHPNAISEIVQFIPSPALLGNFDWLAVSLMMVLFSFQGGLFLLCANQACIDVFKCKNIKEEKIEKWTLLFTNVLMVVLMYTVFQSYADLRLLGINYLKYLALLIMVILLAVFFAELAKFNKDDKKLIRGQKDNKKKAKLNKFEAINEKNN